MIFVNSSGLGQASETDQIISNVTLTLLLWRLISKFRLLLKYDMKVLLLFYEIHVILNISKSSRLPNIGIKSITATSWTELSSTKLNI